MPKNANTRFQILVVASALFAKNGYRGTSIRHIVKICKLKQPSLYHYFEDKEHLYEEAIKATRELFIRTLRNCLTKNLDLETELYSYFQIFDAWRDVFEGTLFPKDVSVMTHFLTAAPEKIRRETAFYLERGIRRIVESTFRRHGIQDETKVRLFLTTFYGFFFLYSNLLQEPFPKEDVLTYLKLITGKEPNLKNQEESYKKVKQKISQVKKYLLEPLKKSVGRQVENK